MWRTPPILQLDHHGQLDYKLETRADEDRSPSQRHSWQASPLLPRLLLDVERTEPGETRLENGDSPHTDPLYWSNPAGGATSTHRDSGTQEGQFKREQASDGAGWHVPKPPQLWYPAKVFNGRPWSQELRTFEISRQRRFFKGYPRTTEKNRHSVCYESDFDRGVTDSWEVQVNNIGEEDSAPVATPIHRQFLRGISNPKVLASCARILPSRRALFPS